MLKTICEHQHLPDYDVYIEDNMVVFIAAANGISVRYEDTVPPLKTETFEHFKARYHGHDPYSIEATWRDWARGKKVPKNPDAAFLAFSEKYIKQRLA